MSTTTPLHRGQPSAAHTRNERIQQALDQAIGYLDDAEGSQDKELADLLAEARRLHGEQADAEEARLAGDGPGVGDRIRAALQDGDLRRWLLEGRLKPTLEILHNAEALAEVVACAVTVDGDNQEGVYPPPPAHMHHAAWLVAELVRSAYAIEVYEDDRRRAAAESS